MHTKYWIPNNKYYCDNVRKSWREGENASRGGDRETYSHTLSTGTVRYPVLSINTAVYQHVNINNKSLKSTNF